MKTLKGTPDLSGVKRCYIKGITHKEICPKCNGEMEWDATDYFSYPENGEDGNLYFYCGQCDEGYILPIIFNSSVTLTINGELEHE